MVNLGSITERMTGQRVVDVACWRTGTDRQDRPDGPDKPDRPGEATTARGRPPATHTAGTRSAGAKLSVLVGAIALTVGTLAARSRPATSYEVSIYAATPLPFWIGAVLGFVCAFAAGVLGRRRAIRRLSLVLAGLSFLAVVGLPLIRGYAFHGVADSLSHLGWVRDLVKDHRRLETLLYPGMHGTALFVHSITAASLTRTLLLVPLVYTLVFPVGVTLAVREITGDWTAVLLGTFSGFMLLPINNISAQMTAHPSTLAILLTPFVLAVLSVYLRESRPDGLVAISATGVVLALCTTAIVLIHPQQAANFLLVLSAITVVQLHGHVRGTVRRVSRPVFGQFAWLGTGLFVWSLGHTRVREGLVGFATALASLWQTGGFGTVSQRQNSLTAIGASLEEVFLKLFLVSAIYLVCAGVAVVASLGGRPGEVRAHGRGFGGGDRRGVRHIDRLWEDLVSLFGIGLVPIGVLFGLYLLANTQTMYFRHVGFIMALVTVLGAVGLRRLVGPVGDPSVDSRTPLRTTLGRWGTATGVGVMLVLSLLVLYQSPYMYKPTMHVTEGNLAGHETAFTYGHPDIEFYGIRQGPDRFRDAIRGTGTLDSDRSREARGVPPPALRTGLARAYGRRVYIIVSRFDRAREIVAFEELRYSEAALANIGATPAVHRVTTNGAVELYLVA